MRKSELGVMGSTAFIGPHQQVLRAELLKRLRAIERKDTDSSLSSAESKETQQLTDALIVSINGIAQGMRNSG
eukprot:scaffold12235_cov44-Attheya_sp.AAC.2